jgi:hypothetical protein
MLLKVSRYPENRGRLGYDEISGSQRVEILRWHTVRIIDNLAIQENSRGRIVAHINLNESYETCIPYEGNGRGIYRFSQGHRVLEFSSEIPNAKPVAKEIFGFKKWPPDRYLIAPWEDQRA